MKKIPKWFWVFFIPVGLTVLLYVKIHFDNRRSVAAAKRDLPIAQQILASDQSFFGVTVDVYDEGRAKLWFFGKCSTDADNQRLEAELRRRFGDKEYMLITTIFCDDSSNVR